MYPRPSRVYIIPFLNHLRMSFFFKFSCGSWKISGVNIQDRLQQKLNGEAEVTWVDISKGQMMWLKLVIWDGLLSGSYGSYHGFMWISMDDSPTHGR